MRKMVIGLFCAMLLLVLAGCEQIQEPLEKYAMDMAGIAENEDYQTYLDLQEKGLLDEEGLYKDAEMAEETETPRGSVMVSFAQNSCLDVKYYTEEGPIEGTVWYLEPGEAIYAEDMKVTAEFDDFYAFDKFVVYTCEGDSRKEFTQSNEEENMVLRIPEGWEGASFSIVPVGKYLQRTLKLDDYAVINGERRELNGRWMINGKGTADSTVSISPISSYAVEYEYDARQYHVTEISPKGEDNQEGVVHFDVVNGNKGVDTFTVKLEPYEKIDLKVTIENSLEKVPFEMVIKAGEPVALQYDKEKKGVAFEDRAEVGGSIAFSTTSSFSADKAVKFALTKTDDGGKKYTSIQYMTGSAGHMDVEIYSGEQDEGRVYKKIEITMSLVEALTYEPATITNGTVTLAMKEDGRELTAGAMLEKGREVVVTVTPDNGYYVLGSKEENGVYTQTMKFEKWEKEKEKILGEHPVKKVIWVTLPEKDQYGTCVYTLGDKEVKGEIIVHAGDKLKLEYTLTDDNYEIVRDWLDEKVTGLFGDSKKAEGDFTVTEDVDGKTLKLSDFGIEVKKKEGEG